MDVKYDFFHMYGGGYTVYYYPAHYPRPDSFGYPFRKDMRDFATKWGAKRWIKWLKENEDAATDLRSRLC